MYVRSSPIVRIFEEWVNDAPDNLTESMSSEVLTALRAIALSVESAVSVIVYSPVNDFGYGAIKQR